MKGTVKFFDHKKGFGFISGDEDKEYFVHISNIAEGEQINDNDIVEFETEVADRGPKAVNVRKSE